MMKNKNNLITFFLKLIVFGLILSLLIIKFFLPYAPDIGEEEDLIVAFQKLDQQEPDFYDILFFTNSYIFTAFDPVLIKEDLGLEALHLASSAQRLETAVILANEVIKKHKPSYVVFDVSIPTIPSPAKEEDMFWYYQTTALQERRLSKEKAINLTNFYPVKTQTEKYISAMSKNAGRLFRLNKLNDYSTPKFTTYTSSPLNVYFTYNGFMGTNTHKIVDEKIFDGAYGKEPEPTKNQDYLFEKSLVALMDSFLEETSRRGIEVIFVHTLKMNPAGYKSKILDNWIESYPNVRFIDFNQNKEHYSLRGKDFFDKTHVNYSGSIQVTNSLIDSLSTWYSLPKIENKELDFKYFKFKRAFYNLNKQEDKFIKFEFEGDFPKELNDYKLVVSLYPKDSLLLSDYSKKQNFKSDNFYIEMDKVETIKNGDSKIFFHRLTSKIDQNTLKNLKIYFYHPNDTLNLPVYNLDDLKL